MIKPLLSNAGGAGSVPDRGAKITHALQPENQNIKQKQCCTHSIKTLKNVVHMKKDLNISKYLYYHTHH